MKKDNNGEKETKKNSKETKVNSDKRIKNSGFIDAWKNAINGIIYATTTQSNIKKQLIIAVVVVVISLFFNLSKAEFLCFLFTIILILFAEMTNTAIETVVDLCTEVYHPKAKIAKDVAAGGVVVTTINAVIVAYFLFFDKLSEMGIAFSKTNKHKIFNDKFIPSGHATIAFAANTIIWISTQNPVILILSLVMAILIAESRIQAKEHRLSEVIFSACLGTILVLVLYGIARLFIA